MLLHNPFPTRQIPSIQPLSRYGQLAKSRHFHSCSSHFYAIDLRWPNLPVERRLSGSTILEFAVVEHRTTFAQWQKLWEELFRQVNTHPRCSCILCCEHKSKTRIKSF